MTQPNADSRRTFAFRLNVALDMHVLSGTTLAQKLGVSKSAVSQWRVGRRYPTFLQLAGIIQNLPRADARWLITGASNESQSP